MQYVQARKVMCKSNFCYLHFVFLIDFYDHFRATAIIYFWWISNSLPLQLCLLVKYLVKNDLLHTYSGTLEGRPYQIQKLCGESFSKVNDFLVIYK